MFDGAGEEGVCEAGEGAGGVELGVGEGGGEVFEDVAGFELAAGVVEAAELDGDLGLRFSSSCCVLYGSVFWANLGLLI